MGRGQVQGLEVQIGKLSKEQRLRKFRCHVHHSGYAFLDCKPGFFFEKQSANEQTGNRFIPGPAFVKIGSQVELLAEEIGCQQ
ncbi:MAG: hypothetical protein D3924_12640 [Candidatus Electrothrix sp. AR4]|nr:hypothetical protein [Candidatus Electrothrix sp. AR4]